MEQSSRGTPGLIHLFYKSFGLPILPSTTGYVLKRNSLKSLCSLFPSLLQPPSFNPSKTTQYTLQHSCLPESPTHLSTGGSVLFHLIFCVIPLDARAADRFSALIWVGALSQAPLKLIQAVADSKHCAQILVLWSSERPPPLKWPETAVPLTVINGPRKVRYRRVRVDSSLNAGNWGGDHGMLSPVELS